MKRSVIAVLILSMVLLFLGACGDSEKVSKEELEKNGYNNPLDSSQAKPDPFVYKHTDGYYYGMHTYQKNGYVPRLVMYKSKNLSDLFTSQRKLVWKAPKTGWNKENIWAPELYFIDNVWYIYYSGGCRTGVLKNTSGDPMNDKWEDAGRLYVEGADEWAIDGTILKQNGKMYFIWSGITNNEPGVQKLFISEMSSPTKLTGPRVMLSRPEYEWEKQGADNVFNVNEGPAVLQRNGKNFLTYSASFCSTPNYCLGMLTIDEKSDPMDLKAWTKSKEPVFKASEENGLWGVGHNSFTTSPDGKEDWLVYHAMLNTKLASNRTVCLQKIIWKKDGTPDFGIPSGRYEKLLKPSGETT